MKIKNTYKLRIVLGNHSKTRPEYNEHPWVTRKELNIIIGLYRNVCDYLVQVINTEWDNLKDYNLKQVCSPVEKLIHATKQNPSPKYSDFDIKYHKLPCYLRRAAIRDAAGHVSSYRSNWDDWNNLTDKEKANKTEPKFGASMHAYPTFYKGNMFQCSVNEDVVTLKVFDGHDWVWRYVLLRRQDLKYVNKHCAGDVRCNPTLVYYNEGFSLDVCFVRHRVLVRKSVRDQRILAVDLGINTHATVCVMLSDGTILARKFIHFGKEEDRLNKMLGRIKRKQSVNHSRSLRNKWSRVKSYNEGLSCLIGHAIVDYAVLFECDVIVMEYLDFHGKIRGSRKYRLNCWRKRGIQKIVENQAHVHCKRYSRVCAWNTSRLAFDGSGEVKRGSKGGFNTYALCRFKSGKVYNADLNACYNIGARYFIRELLKSLPGLVKQLVLAKVPELARRTFCILSSLIELNADSTFRRACGF